MRKREKEKREEEVENFQLVETQYSISRKMKVKKDDA